MSMTEAQLTSLRARLLRASQRGYGVARAGDYAKALGGTGDETSAAELLALCDAALSGEPPTKPKPAPKKAAPPPPPAPEPEEDEMEDEESEEAPPYEEWLKADLAAEAEARGLEVKSSMTKAELVELLEADDEE